MERRVVITALGAITPIGNNVEETWKSIENKKYTTYDFDGIQSKIIEYYEDREKLAKKGISNNEYENILIVMDKISKEYNI